MPAKISARITVTNARPVQKTSNNLMPFFIRKASGQKEAFNIKKFRQSLHKAGADAKLIDTIISQIKKQQPRSTKAIHATTTAILAKHSPHIAGRYNLKRALMELGPAGFPFEQFVAHIFKAMGYKVNNNVNVAGKCVEHEIDIIAKKDDKHSMIECKFHNRSGLKSDVKVTLYMQARFDDIRAAWEADPQHGHEFHHGWVITNTKFTSQALKYGSCMGIKLLGWKYPVGKGIAELIDNLGLHPITALTSLSRSQKRQFIKNGFVLCRDAQKHKALLKQLGFSPHQTKKLIHEAEAICELQ